MNLRQHMSPEDFERLTADLTRTAHRARGHAKISKDPHKKARHHRRRRAAEKALCAVQGRQGRHFVPHRVKKARRRVERTLTPTPPVCIPDSKAEKRLRDRQLRNRMRGIQRSAPNPHGQRKKK